MLESTGQAPKFNPEADKPVDPTKNPHAVALGRLGGLKGGAARAEALSPRKRSQIAAKAARARWGGGNQSRRQMTITLEDAILLLQKWREERRLIQCGLVYSPEISSCVVGRIEEITATIVKIDARSLRRRGSFDSVLFNPSSAIEFLFHDWRDAPPEFSQQLQEAYEGHIFARFRNCHCEIYAMKTGDELPST
jgi:hypothetical protein